MFVMLKTTEGQEAFVNIDDIAAIVGDRGGKPSRIVLVGCKDLEVDHSPEWVLAALQSGKGAAPPAAED